MVASTNMFGVLPKPKPPQFPTRGSVPGLVEYYHGTTLENANRLAGEEIGVYSVPAARLLDDSEYTDFGKGFYIHPPENRKLSIDWAKNAASRSGADWGVMCVRMTQTEYDAIAGQILNFKTKRSDRPSNAPLLGAATAQRRELEGKITFRMPWLKPFVDVDEAILSVFDQRCTWIEFVEFNRHVTPSIKRPKDNDWSADYGLIRGPIWVQKDSGLPGKLPPFAEHVQQINLGVEGLKVINAPSVKSRRYVINKDNENLPPP